MTRHTRLATSVAIVVTGFVVYGVAMGSPPSLSYGAVIVSGAFVVAAVEPEEGFGRLSRPG